MDETYRAIVEAEKRAAKLREQSGKGENGSGGRGNKRNPTQTIGEGLGRHAAESDAKIADLTATNGQYVADPRKIAEVAPDLLEEIVIGTKTVPQAKIEVKKRTKVAELERKNRSG